MLLLARAANDAAEPWGFSNFCIVAHPCAGHKKSRNIYATTSRRHRGTSPACGGVCSTRAKAPRARKRAKCVPLKEIAAVPFAQCLVTHSRKRRCCRAFEFKLRTSRVFVQGAFPIAESRRAVFARHRANEANTHQAAHGNAGRGLLPSGGTAHAPQRIPNTREAGRRAARLYRCAPFSHCSCPSGSPCFDMLIYQVKRQ